jgi:hypothetical protein
MLSGTIKMTAAALEEGKSALEYLPQSVRE